MGWRGRARPLARPDRRELEPPALRLASSRLAAPVPEAPRGSRQDLSGAPHESEADALRERLARHQAFSAVLADGARQLIGPPPETLDAAVDAYLESLGHFARADRCYLFQVCDDPDYVTNTNEWCEDGVPPQIQDLEAVATAELPWFWAELSSAGIVHLPRVSDLDPEAAPEREIFESGGIRSLLCVAIELRGEQVGFLGFDAVRQERSWSDEEVELLRRSTALFAGVVERRWLEQERLQLQRQLIHSSKLEAVGRLAGGVAHDFNNLLTVITGNLSLLLHPKSTLSAEQREDLETAREATLHAGELTRQLLTFGRRQVLRPEALDVEVELRALLPLLRRLLREDVSLESSAEPDLPRISADPALLPQVLLNLVGNAADAITGAGRIWIHARRDPTRERRIQLSVRDDGPGLSAEARERLFEPFFSTKGDLGTGLGLATVYGAVRQHGGEVAIGSDRAGGTEILVSLPTSVPSTPRRRRSEPRDLEPAWGSLALVVEDEERLQGLLARALAASGWETQVVAHGAQALELPDERLREFDLLVSDVVMPVLSGPELYRAWARRLGTTPPTLFISGYAGERIADPALQAASFLQKPFTPDEFLSAVAALGPTKR